MFQSTRPRGARQTAKLSKCRIFLFQSTRPRGARQTRQPSARKVTSFNPRAHAGRDFLKNQKKMKREVSIHAPTRGATRKTHQRDGCHRVSIHAPTRGATLIIHSNHDLNLSFNPRAHAGRDLPPSSEGFTSSKFQSTRPRGARQVRADDVSDEVLFQSTRPRGARRK